MRFVDITDNVETTYVLDCPGRNVFFLFNRSGTITFKLAAPGAEAHVFALFFGTEDESFELDIRQEHQAPDTVSHLLAKSVLSGRARFRYEGLIKIEKEAQRSDASQTCRNLVLSPDAQAFSRPDLEILADDVACRHAATTSQPNPDHLFYAQSRGLDRTQAERLLTEGFIGDLFKEMERLGKFDGLEKYKNLSEMAITYKKTTGT
jgi:Fe-S cluster assembly scaffold protein SufB